MWKTDVLESPRGQAAAQGAPLVGVRVLDLTRLLPGPMCAMHLADLGADVIKVEDLGAGDYAAAGVRHQVNRNKRGIRVDLKHPDGVATLRDLVAWADVLVENFRPGAMDRLGFLHAAMSALNPRLVYLSFAGFGHSGSYAGFEEYDPVIQAVSGFADAHPNPETGEPQLLQTMPEFGANQKLWRARDGWFAMITPQDNEFAGMCRTLGVPELAGDPRFLSISVRRRHQAELRALIEPLVREESVNTLVQRLGDAGVPVGRVNSKRELAQDPQVQCNDVLHDTSYPDLGRIRAPRMAARVGATSAHRPVLAPHLGEHTVAVLSELGRSAQEIERLLETGVAQAHQPVKG